ncbi:MAG: hypothetical protein ACI9WS_000255 [Paraglaciecola psychrophila]|jgi:hypothetical protein
MACYYFIVNSIAEVKAAASRGGAQYNALIIDLDVAAGTTSLTLSLDPHLAVQSNPLSVWHFTLPPASES